MRTNHSFISVRNPLKNATEQENNATEFRTWLEFQHHSAAAVKFGWKWEFISFSLKLMFECKEKEKNKRKIFRNRIKMRGNRQNWISSSFVCVCNTINCLVVAKRDKYLNCLYMIWLISSFILLSYFISISLLLYYIAIQQRATRTLALLMRWTKHRSLCCAFICWMKWNVMVLDTIFKWWKTKNRPRFFVHRWW